MALANDADGTLRKRPKNEPDRPCVGAHVARTWCVIAPSSATAPGKWGIAVVSPPLDAAGNSIRAQRAIADISDALGGNPYSGVRRRRSRE